MEDYQKTRLWQSSLAPQQSDDEKTCGFRSRLRQAYEQFRVRANVLANEIQRDLPDFTVHDITHSDTLWSMADLIAGENITLTPTEAFVLGGAFLVHDLGMGLAAYQEGLTDLKKHPYWMDTVVAVLKEEVGRVPGKDEIDNLSNDTIIKAKEALLRELHASKAEKLIALPWKEKNSNREYFLIEDMDLQQTYGELIGKIAYSHWWPITTVEQNFDASVSVGAPYWLPRDWIVDPLLLACLLRVADISHIDASRAPGFLRALRKPQPDSRDHWIFQEHLQQPHLNEDRLTYTSGRSFPLKEASAWWLCFDTLRTVDHELRMVDALLADSRRKRFAARGVTAIEESRRLAKYIKTDGWLPLDARIQVTDLPHLIQKLGGEELYGPDLIVPLRELIQNAADAVRARRIDEERSPNWGNVDVRLGQDATGYWLEVEDTGIGMSSLVLTGPLLDFGKSFWGSMLMRHEFPGLLSKGFQSTGKYGIGFFSVFMWGDRVHVTSRRFDDAQSNTLVLEFNNGLTSRPILREAEKSERIRDGGTRVRVWLQNLGVTDDGLLAMQNSLAGLKNLCAYLCPSIDVNLYVTEFNAKKSELVIGALDWIDCDAKVFIERLKSPFKYNEDDSDEDEDDSDKDEIDGINENIDNVISKIDSNLRLLINQSGEIVGRACLFPRYQLHRSSWVPIDLNGVVTAGGLRASSLSGVVGVFPGHILRASRDVAWPIVEEPVLASWATEQADLVKNFTNDYELLHELASFVLQFGGDVRDLPIALGKHGNVSYYDIINWKDMPDEILLASDVDIYYKRKNQDDIILHENVLGVEWGLPILMGGVKDDRFRWLNERGSSLLSLVIDAIAEVWHVNAKSAKKMVFFLRRNVLREIGSISGLPFVTDVTVLKRREL